MKKVFIALIFFTFVSLCANAVSYNNCASLYSQKKYLSAKRCCESILKTNYRNADARYLKGLAQYRLGDKQGAYATFDDVRSMFPGTDLARRAYENQKQMKTYNTSSAKANKTDYGNYLGQVGDYAKWQAMPIKVWVQPTKYSQTIYSAFNEWQNASQGTVRFTRTNSESMGKIKVYIVKEIPGAGSSVQGLTTYSKSGGIMYGSVIRLKYETPQRINLSNKQMYALALHEIGHAIGITGHSSNNNDVMYPSTDIVGIHTSKRDINTLKAIYN